LPVGPKQKTRGGTGIKYGGFEIDEELESGGHAVGDSVVDSCIGTCFVEFGESPFLSGHAECRFGGDVQIRPPGKSFGRHLLMGDEIEDWLLLGLQIAPVEQFIECEGLHLRRYTLSPRLTPV
jgi:hypothetical protein